MNSSNVFITCRASRSTASTSRQMCVASLSMTYREYAHAHQPPTAPMPVIHARISTQPAGSLNSFNPMKHSRKMIVSADDT